MIEIPALVNGLLCGCALIIFGSVPGLLQSLVEGLHNFSRAIHPNLAPPHGQVQVGRQPFALVLLGFALIVFVCVAYILPSAA